MTIKECIPHLVKAGIDLGDAHALRRAAMKLHRWYELECGDSNDYASHCLVRGKKSADGFEYAEDGRPYLETHYHDRNKPTYTLVPDREAGARKRVDKIISHYPGFSVYHQTDPRGAPLYVLRPGDVPEGASVDSCYNRGLAVYK